MFLYSETINAFLTRLKKRSREILRDEMGITCHQSRFEWKRHLIPFHLVVFEDPKKVGFFDSRFYQIGLNKALVHQSNKQVIDNILRHEWAHFYCYLQYGDTIEDHGTQFRAVCKMFGWSEDVYGATIDLTIANRENTDHEFEDIKRKIKKLLNLAAGSSGPEAEAATLKANQMLTKYNLELLEDEADLNEENVCLMRVYEAKRVNAQLNALYEILAHFQVYPVISKGKGVSFLEIIGNRHHVELADYMAKFLLVEMESSYKLFKKQNPALKGTVAKNSYLKGWARGICQKLMGQEQKDYAGSKALVSLKFALEKKVSLVYPRLASTTSRTSKFCHQSAASGAQDGLNTSIKKGINPSHQKLLT